MAAQNMAVWKRRMIEIITRVILEDQSLHQCLRADVRRGGKRNDFRQFQDPESK
jgi:hypothetical protein